MQIEIYKEQLNAAIVQYDRLNKQAEDGFNKSIEDMIVKVRAEIARLKQFIATIEAGPQSVKDTREY